MHMRSQASHAAITWDQSPPRVMAEAAVSEVPAYLRDTYDWAYLKPRNVRLLDREWVVKVILWGQHRRLRQVAFAEIEPGGRVLLPTHVYGEFVAALAGHIGPRGSLTVTDVAPVQVAQCRRKLRGFPQAVVHRADAAQPGAPAFDRVCCYFLLHEVPDTVKRQVVASLLGRVVPGGKVIFIDYHRPHWAHPLRGVTSLVFRLLEPFAKSLWRTEIEDLAGGLPGFTWTKEVYFGGLFQKVIARRREEERPWR